MRQLYQRSDIDQLIHEDASLLLPGDTFYVLKYSQKNWDGPVAAWRTVNTFMYELIDHIWETSLSPIDHIHWGYDRFKTGYPHINMIIHWKPESTPQERGWVESSIQLEWLLKQFPIKDKWQCYHKMHLESTGTQWTPTWFKKNKSLFYALRYIYRRTLEPQVRYESGNKHIGVMHLETFTTRNMILMYPHKKENGIDLIQLPR